MITTDVITMGEALVVGRTQSPGPLRHADTLRLDVAGAENNVAIGLRRLGHRVSWLGRVGDDEFGAKILATLRGEDVDVSGAVLDTEAPTAFMTKEYRTATTTRMAYYRAGSAGSRLCPADIDLTRLRAAKILHVTGITVALSQTARQAVHAAIDAARHGGALVSVDVNYRARLWPDRASAASALHELARHGDIVFASEDELDLVDAQPRELVVTRGAAGAQAHLPEGIIEQEAMPAVAVDPVGAGDGFVAGYLSGLLDGLPPTGRLRRGAVLGAFAVSSHSDWQGLPRRDELALVDATSGTTVR